MSIRYRFDQREYGSVIIVNTKNTSTITTSTILFDAMLAGAFDLVKNFDTHYSRCHVDLLIDNGFGGGEVFRTGMQFNSLSDLADTLNIILPKTGPIFSTRNIRMRVYDFIDDGIPGIHKITGNNYSFTKLLSGRNLGSRPQGTSGWVREDSPWANMQTYLSEIWTAVMSESFPLPLFPTEAYQLFWVPSSGHKRMVLPAYRGLKINPPQNLRRVWNGSATELASTSSSLFTDQSLFNHAIVGSPFNGGPPTIVGKEKSYSAHIMRMGGGSVMIAYPVVNLSSRRAVYLRPLGIDQIYTNIFDTTRYRLEAFSRFDANSNPNVRVVGDPVSGVWHNSQGPYELMSWASGSARWEQRRMKESLPSDVYLHLRDTVTNKVSRLSEQYMVWKHFTHAFPPGVVIQNQGIQGG
jgi:hypothetical protein